MVGRDGIFQALLVVQQTDNSSVFLSYSQGNFFSAHAHFSTFPKFIMFFYINSTCIVVCVIVISLFSYFVSAPQLSVLSILQSTLMHEN